MLIKTGYPILNTRYSVLYLNVMTAEEILKDLKARKFKPIYFLHGEESYYIDKISSYIEDQLLNEAEKGFNQTVLYGKDTDIMTILNAAKRFPMMSEYQVVLVKEAQNLKFGKESSKDQDPFSAYVENPLKSTILVFCYKYGTLDKRLKIAKSIEKNGVLFESKKLYDNQVAQWVGEYIKTKSCIINAKAAALIAEYLGNDLSKIANELDKLMLNVKEHTEIGVKEVEQNIGISKDFNSFELTAALGRKDIFKANQIIDYFAANKKDNPMVVTLGTLNNYFTKIFAYHFLADKSRGNVASALKVSPYFVGDYELASKNYSPDKTFHIISLLRKYDLRSKGVDNTGNTEEGELLKELVFQILH
jgi:DNA polymerase III subunit delta